METRKELPTAKNDVYNHDAVETVKAIGISRKDYQKAVDFLNNTHKECELDSQFIEKVDKSNLSRKELIFLMHAAVSQS